MCGCRLYAYKSKFVASLIMESGSACEEYLQLRVSDGWVFGVALCTARSRSLDE